jgi:predicted pyridoxine 5'-phosphate oxidase superfamily flavin-nucleotide-binding protein
MLDFSTDFGQRAKERLEREPVAWLVTVGSDGTPQPSPIWYL